jgi:hypothetical protein
MPHAGAEKVHSVPGEQMSASNEKKSLLFIKYGPCGFLAIKASFNEIDSIGLAKSRHIPKHVASADAEIPIR